VYADDTWTNFLKTARLPWADMVAQGYEVVLARTEIDYKNAALMGAQLDSLI
jgi:acyl-CoA thioesterase FadM